MYIPAWNPSLVTLLVVTALLLTAAAVVCVSSRHKKSSHRQIELAGAIGVVETSLDPEGSVLIDGELWPARSRAGGSSIERGRLALVVGASGHQLLVKQVE